VPTRSAINIEGVNVTSADMDELLTVNVDERRAEVPSIREHLAQFGDRLPAALDKQVDALEQRLG
jgi:phosphoenolpyruvate carboxykinase (GTP)